jgi:hypothetical protein
MLGVLIAILVAALVYSTLFRSLWIAAILVLLAGVGTSGFGGPGWYNGRRGGM